MTGVGDDSRGRLLGRPWLVVGFVLAIGATLALVLSDDLRYLRLGIVAALWAALIGAFLAVKYRKHAAQSEDAVAEAQAVYELELEREIAARREFELEVEAEKSSVADSKGREELEALRAEVSALRDSLQSLFGGEVLLERVALTAQATRMRKVSDENRLVTDGAPKKKPAQLMAGKKPVPEGGERPTELIDRVLDERRRKASNGKPANGKGLGKGKGFGGKPVPKTPANVSVQSTQQMARPKPLSDRRPPVPPVDPALNAAQRELKAAELRAEAARRQAESQPMRLPKPEEAAKQPERRPEVAAEPTRRDVPPRPADPKTEIRRPTEPKTEIRRPQPPEPKTEIRRPQPPEPKTEIRRPEPPPARRAEMSRSDIRPVEVSRTDIPRVEMSRPDIPRVEAPRPEAPRPGIPQMPRVEAPRPNVSRAEASRSDIPRVEMSRPDIPRVEMSRPDIPRVEMSRPDIPRVEMSRPDIPRVEMSRPDIPRVEMSRPDLPRVGGQPNGVRPEPRKAPEPPRAVPGRPAANVPPVKPSEMSRSDIRPVKDLSAAFQNRDDFAERQRPNRPKPPEPMPRDAAASRTDIPPVVPPTTPVPSKSPSPRQPSRTDLPPVVPPTTPVPAADSRRPSRLEQFSRADMSPILEEPPSRHGGSHRAPAEAAKAETPMANPTLPESVRNFQGRSGGRRRKPEDSQQLPAVPAAPEPPGGGRRRRPDGEPPAWEGMVAERASMSRRGMTPVDPAEVEQNGHNGSRNGHRAAPEPAPGSGSHAAGRSVSELLAANGGTGSTPRRRRRAED
ncbi:DUF6779 domain-containing protein [Amycolatopsis sp. lyj-23]|uniref:DUF6779 domain-containing protein n=1 Tax=Amycolatopsis sp. lyj-23 TaxID=2789283 RepID=UPI00397A5C91